MKNSLTFSEDGTSFIINFASGSESFDIYSKEEGIKAISILAKDSKITDEDRTAMRDQILEAKNLPWWSTDKKTGRLFSDSAFSKIFLEVALLSSFLSLGDTYAAPDEPVEEAYLKVCSNCKKHGRIYTKKCYTNDLDSKANAMEVLNKLKELDEVSSEEYEKVKKQIEESALSE
jgi:hypothetical protein